MEFKSAYAKAQTQAYIAGNVELEELLVVMLERHCDLVGEIAGLELQLQFAKQDTERLTEIAKLQEKIICLESK